MQVNAEFPAERPARQGILGYLLQRGVIQGKSVNAEVSAYTRSDVLKTAAT